MPSDTHAQANTRRAGSTRAAAPAWLVLPFALVVLLLLAPQAAWATPDSALCTGADLWPLCARDPTCAWLYRHDEARGLDDALAYFGAAHATGRLLPFWPAVWQNASLGGVLRPSLLFGAQTCGTALAAASLWGATTQPITTEAALGLIVLVHYKSFIASSMHGCTDPHEVPVYDALTGQYVPAHARAHAVPRACASLCLLRC